MLNSKTAHSSKEKLSNMTNKGPVFTTRAQYVKDSIRNENLFCFFQWIIRYLKISLRIRFMSQTFFIMSVSDLWMKEWDAKELFGGKATFLFGNASLPVRFTAGPWGHPGDYSLWVVAMVQHLPTLIIYLVHRNLKWRQPFICLRCWVKVSVDISDLFQFPFCNMSDLFQSRGHWMIE